MANFWTFVTLAVCATEQTLLSQEIGALEDIIATAQKKVNVLKELQSKVGKAEQDLHPVAHSLLKTPLPSLTELPSKVAGSADDVSFKISKIATPFPVQEVKLVPLKASSPGTATATSIPQALVRTPVNKFE